MEDAVVDIKRDYLDEDGLNYILVLLSLELKLQKLINKKLEDRITVLEEYSDDHLKKRVEALEKHAMLDDSYEMSTLSLAERISLLEQHALQDSLEDDVE